MKTKFDRGFILVAMSSLIGCGGGGASGSSGTSPTCTACTVGGAVSGLNAGQSAVILNNGGDPHTLSSNGSFTFDKPAVYGGAYDVTVQSHTPGITCSVNDGSGTVGTSSVTNIAVSCAAGTATILHSFAGAPSDGVTPQTDLVMDSAGNFYGTTRFGGADSLGSVFRISSSGTETLIYSFANATTDGSSPVASLIMDSTGNLYGITNNGGAAGQGTVFKVSPTGAETVLHSFAGGSADGALPHGPLIIDSAGNLYGTTYEGGTDNDGTVFRISAAGTETVLHSFAGGATDGAWPDAGLLMDSAGNLYGTTYVGGVNNEGTVFKISGTGTETVLYSFMGGTTDGAEPRAALIMDSAGNLYGTTWGGGAANGGTVFKISSAGKETLLHSFAGGSDGAGVDGSLVMDGTGNLYGTTFEGGVDNDGTVFEISAAGTETVVHTFMGGTTDGSGPGSDLTMDTAGNIYGTTVQGGVNDDGTAFEIN